MYCTALCQAGRVPESHPLLGISKHMQPFDAHRHATENYSGGISTPSPGLNLWQMAETLKQMGYYPIMYHKRSFGAIGRDWVIPDMIYPYLNSSIPVIAISYPKKQARQSVLIIGSKLEQLSKESKKNWCLWET